jgi:hypothetical protein
LVVVALALPAVVAARQVVPALWPHRRPDSVQLISDHSQPIRDTSDDGTPAPDPLPVTTAVSQRLDPALYPTLTSSSVVRGELQWISTAPVRASGHGSARILNARPLTTGNLQHTEVRIGSGTALGGGPVRDGMMEPGQPLPGDATGAEIDASRDWNLYVLGALGPNDTYGAFFGVRLTLLQDDRITVVDVPTNGQLCSLPYVKDFLNPVALPAPCAHGDAAYPRQARQIFGGDDLG